LASRSKSIRKKGKDDPKARIIVNRSRLDTLSVSEGPELFSSDGYHVFSLMLFSGGVPQVHSFGIVCVHKAGFSQPLISFW
jgi:hypothetical protein